MLESFSGACAAPLPPWVDRVLADRNAGAQVRAFAQSLTRYRDPEQIKYLKLADGGITDNFGLSGLVIARAAAEKPYMPLSPEKVVRLRRFIFVVVNAGQAPEGDWARTVDGPTGTEMLNAVTDTAMNSAVRSGFDAFRLSIREWEEAIRKWRCSLPAAEARRLGASADWRCSNFKFEIAEVGFDLFDPQRAAKLSLIPTRFKLPTEDVDFLVQSGTPGSAVDVTFRIVMDRLGTELGQQIVPVDDPGASGAIAAHAASEAIPDGNTLFAPATSLFIALPGKAENLPLMLPRDFLPVASLIDQPMFICASAASDIKTLPDLIARAKQHPNQISFAATAIGRITHLTGLLLQSRADIKLQVVPTPAARRPRSPMWSAAASP